MNKFGIIIGANLMFLLTSIPFVTLGAGFVALYHVMLKTLREDGSVNPFKEFWAGFKNNFKQATICWIGFVLIAFILVIDIRICGSAEGFIRMFAYGAYGIMALLLVSYCFLLPTMAAFADSIPHLIRNGWFFALKRPLVSLVILFFDLFPLMLTYTDPKNLPLYAFLWSLFGFGAIAMLGSTLLLKQFEVYLPKNDEDEYFDWPEDDAAMLEELKMLDGL